MASCCGSSPRVSLQGLVAQADAHPANSPQGRHARAKLAYTIVAAKAAQAGNRPMFHRAMGSLRGLGDGPTLSTHGTVATPEGAAEAAPAIRATLESLIAQGGDPAARAIFTQLQTVGGVLAGLASLGTEIASRVSGSDPRAIAAANMVISWVRTLLSGSAPTIPTLSANEVQSLVAFCRVAPDVQIGVTSVFSAASIATAAAGNSGATNALLSLQAWIEAILTGICNIPQIRTATTAVSAAASCAALGPHWTTDAENSCVCEPGYRRESTSNVPPYGACVPVTAPPSGDGTVFTLTLAQRRGLVAARSGVPVASLIPVSCRNYDPRTGAAPPAGCADAARLLTLIRVNPSLVTTTAGTLDPVTLCAPGETPNPATGVCDGGSYGPPPAPPSSGGGVVPLAVGAAALWWFFK